MVKQVLLGIVLAVMILALASCNTIQGVGEDISQAGAAITDAAGGAP